MTGTKNELVAEIVKLIESYYYTTEDGGSALDKDDLPRLALDILQLINERG